MLAEKDQKLYLIDQVWNILIREMVKEWNGSLVHISEFEPKHPQLDPPYHKADAIALKNPRVMKFQQPTKICKRSNYFRFRWNSCWCC